MYMYLTNHCVSISFLSEDLYKPIYGLVTRREVIYLNSLVYIALFAAMTSCKNPNEHRVMLHICKVPLITVLGGALSH